MNVLWHMFITFCVALLPILEIRGAIPYGFAFGLEWWQTFIAGVIGNLLPVPFIILFIRKIFFWLKDKNRYVGAIYRLEKRAQAKAAKIQNYQLIGLLLFVAVPLPGTGAWTGALIAAILDLRLKKAFPAIAAGVIIAGLIVTAMTYGIKLFFFT